MQSRSEFDPAGLGPNAVLAYTVLDHIDLHPELWRQDIYIGRSDCGTVGCFAGWADMLSGAEPADFVREQFGDPDTLITSWVRLQSWLQSADGLAEQLLRASRYIYEEYEEIDLFDAYNTREQLGEYVERIFGPRPAHMPPAPQPVTPAPSA